MHFNKLIKIIQPKMCQTFPITRLLATIIFTTLISSVTQPSTSFLVNSAEFGETCEQGPKSKLAKVKPFVHQLQIPSPTLAAETRFDDDYMTYENSNQHQIQVEQTIQAAGVRSSQQRDESDQSSYFRYNEEPRYKSDNEFPIRLSKNNYKMAKNKFKIASLSRQSVPQKSVGVEKPNSDKPGFNPNFKRRLPLTPSTLLRPLYEETFVDNQYTASQASQKNSMTETLDKAFFSTTSKLSTAKYVTELSPDFETSSQSSIGEMSTPRPISEMTTSFITSTKTSFDIVSGRSTSSISGSSSLASYPSENFKLISSTFPFSTSTIHYQEMTATDG